MNSSGIKRGLAASAVAALAVAGLPFLASSANAATGDEVVLGSVGPTLNGGDVGGVVVLKTKNISEAEAEGDPTAANTTAFQLTNTTLNGSPTNANQAVSLVGVPVYTADASDTHPGDGYNEVTLHVAVTTSDPGAIANYALYLDDSNAGANDETVQASEARVQVSQQTSGALASLDVSPATQSAAQGINSGNYTVTAKDSAGRTTQLMAADTVAVTIAPDGTVTQPVLDATELEDGTHTFTAQAPTTGAKTITLDPSAPASVPNATATLNVTTAATLTDSEVDIVTAADDWDGYGGDAGAGNTMVRVDQGTITINFKTNDPNSTVTLNLDGGAGPAPAGITFGGKQTATVSTVLDANGNGSITITPDAFTVQEGNTIAITGSFTETLEFARSQAAAVAPAQDVYFSALKATTVVDATVVDQFGNPIGGGIVTGYIAAGPNAAAPTASDSKLVGADGKVSFSFTDTKATVGTQDTVQFLYMDDQFDVTPTPMGNATIKYTADGMGANYNTTLDTHDTGLATYKASDSPVVPLADANDGGGAESIDIAITGAEASQAITLSVGDGALILKPGDTTLDKGVSSVTATTTVGGALPAGYRIIGTKAGVGTLNIVSAGRTETAQFTVLAQTDTTTARNVTVSGPAEVESGSTQVTFTAVVTDNFGNPIANFPVNNLNIQVTGPGQFQDSDAVSNANGQINLNVRLDSDAQGDVTIKVTGLGNQFGAAANQLTVGAPANGAPGLAASSNVASATSTVAAPEKVDPNCTLGHSQKKKTDKVMVKCDPAAAGAKVTVTGGGQTKTGVLNANGDLTVSFKDKNGNKKGTKYKVTVNATASTKQFKGSVTQK